ncbi:S66 family peptidase [Mesoplasma photuris]|uniref:S66 family peptidase n=1 Tax=Mesoplasma photuris TaxID=217731 RepID=UPI0004E10D3C|nr:S66 peptidase family protein [Mesoplasma photuris]
MKPYKLKVGDKVAVVSLSRRIAGESFAYHVTEKGVQRLKEFGLEVEFMPNALSGVDFIQQNPQARAADLKKAFLDPEYKLIICAIGGEDTFKTIPFLLEDKDFVIAVKNNPKIFIGYSDTTNNHFMLNKLGLDTFYGHALLPDLGELDVEMLEYTKNSFMQLFNGNEFEITSSPIWFEERSDFSTKALNVSRVKHKETKGIEILNGSGIINGKTFGGCIESIYEMITGTRYNSQKIIINKYDLLPSENFLSDKVLFLETSEEKPDPFTLEKMIKALESKNMFSTIKALIIGKPQDEKYYSEYKEIWIKLSQKYNLPIMYNVNFGHAHPKTLIPYNANIELDFDKGKIFIKSGYLE